MLRRIPFPLLRFSFVLGLAILLVAAPPAEARPCWQPPVAGVVTDSFRRPACPYCAGQRGLEYRVDPFTSVRAVASGTVTWAGVVAGTRYVVVRHENGWRATYGQLTATALGAGDVVLAGRVIGVASGRFYFGVRDGAVYLDPSGFLGRQVGRRRLIPTDGTQAWPAPPPKWRCAASAGSTSRGLTR